MASEGGLRLGPSTESKGLQRGDRLSAPDDGVPLAPMLDGIEQVGEVSGGVGSTDLRHNIRLSDAIPEGGTTSTEQRRIAARIFVTPTTVRTHLSRILAKLNLRDRVPAVMFAYECGAVRPGDSPDRTTRDA